MINIKVESAKNSPQAKRIAKAVANSPLVKTAFYGNDPNWGRIVMAIGKTYEKIDPKKQTVIGFGITEKTIGKLKSADGLVVGSAICKEITRSLNNRQNPVTNVSRLVKNLKKKIT